MLSVGGSSPKQFVEQDNEYIKMKEKKKQRTFSVCYYSEVGEEFGFAPRSTETDR